MRSLRVWTRPPPRDSRLRSCVRRCSTPASSCTRSELMADVFRQGGSCPHCQPQWPAAPLFASRREFLAQATYGMSTLALAWLLGEERARAMSPPTQSSADLSARPGHFAARATSVIMLMQVGGPSHVDLFDPKLELQKRGGQTYDGDVEVLQPGSEPKKLMASPFKFE